MLIYKYVMDSVAQCNAQVQKYLDVRPLNSIASRFELGLGSNEPKLHVRCIRRHSPPSSSRASFTAREDGKGGEISVDADALGDVDGNGNESALQEVLAHELTHAHDAMLLGWDLRKCGELACSEIRAAEAGECRPIEHDSLRWSCVRETAARTPKRTLGDLCVTRVIHLCYGSGPLSRPRWDGAPPLPDSDPVKSLAFQRLVAAEAAAAPSLYIAPTR